MNALTLPKTLYEAEQAVFQCLLQRDFLKAEQLAQNLPHAENFPSEQAKILCIVFLESGDPANARRYAEDYHRLAGDGNSLYYLARSRFAAGEHSSLVPVLLSALSLPIAADNKLRCQNLLAQLYRRCGDAAKAVTYYRLAYETGTAAGLPLSLVLTELDNYLFNSHYIPYDAQDLASHHFNYGNIISHHIHPMPLRHHQHGRKKIRIGYISPDLREHAVLSFSLSFFTCADQEKFQIYAYARCNEDEFSQALKKYAKWRNILGLSDESAAQLIAEDEIDILVDLAGHTQGNSLGILAYKPAPVIISGIGYFSTTGLKTIDYFLSDIYLTGASEAGIYEHPLWREKLLVLPRTHWVYTPLHPRPASSLVAPAKRNGYVTFGSFNAMAKANDTVLAAWSEILRRLPDSRLLLKGEAFVDETDFMRIKARLVAAGFDIKRIDMRPSSKDYLDQYADVDISLDTFPYGGGATTMDALYMGVPVISLAGETHHSRFGHSILSNLGLSELSCNTVDEYIERACLIASDIETLDALHANIRNLLENSPLMDSIEYMYELESLYRSILFYHS